MKTLARFVICILLAGPAFAIIDDGTNSLGAYFDPNGEQPPCFTPTPATPFHVYWILANSPFENLGGFEFAWAIVPELVPAPMVLDLALPPNALNIGDNYNLIVGLGSGLITSEATTLATYTLMTIGPTSSNFVTVGPATPASIPGHAVSGTFDNTNAIAPMNFSTVDDVNVIIDDTGWVVPGVAGFNCPGGPIAAESATWSNVKTLFR